MNWKLIFQLSLFGLAMAFATVFVISSRIEPFFWLAIFIVCACVIAMNVQRRYFLHGFLTSLVNCVWITTVQVLLFDQYIATHTEEAQMMEQLNLPISPRMLIALTGPVIGVLSGVVLGVFSVIAAKLIPRKWRAA